jgi:hypothetical protein
MFEQPIRPLPTPAEVPAPQDQHERLELARELYREFHGRCFWHCPRELEITEDLIAFVAKGLRTYGGRRGFVLSGKLWPVRVAEPLRCP